MRQLRVLGLVFCFGLTVLFGCDSSGNTVSGKVTFDGKPVSGDITFTAKGKSVTTPLHPSDGTYTAIKLTAGENTITIKGNAGAIVAPKDEKKP